MGKFTFRLFFILFILSLFCKKGTEAIAQITTQTYNATGAIQPFVVPCGCFSATVQCWGGGGGGGGTDGSGTPASGGGGGAYATTVLTLVPGTTLSLYVGSGGTAGVGCTSGTGGGAGGFGLGNGGAGGNAGAAGCSGPGGGGGGGTGIMNGGTILIVAGGGGGAGGGETGSTFAGAGGAAGVAGSAGNSCAGGILGASGSTSGLSGGEPGVDDPGSGGGGGGLVGGGGGAIPTGGANLTGAGGGAGGTSMGTTVMNGAGLTPGNSGVLAGICGTCAQGGGIDDNGGNGIILITFNNPPPVTCNLVTSAGTCGIATATATAGGGTPGYTYTWTPTGGNAATANLTNGSYTVTVADVNGCTATSNTTIVLPPAVVLTATVTDVLCNGLSTGSATATVSGGTGPTYTVGIINPPQGGITTSTENFSGLAAGAYTVGAQDEAGCQTIFPITITQPNPLTVATTQTNVSCFGGSTGIATTNPTGGTAGYTYNWTPAGGTAATASNLTAQAYTVTVTDANNCPPATATLTITQPALPLSASTTSTEITCNGLTNGSATVTAGGGTAGYTYNWTPAGGTAATASNLSSQNYTVTVTDANSCTATSTVNITQPPALTLTAVTTSVTCFGLSNGSATATASGGTGPTYTVGIIAPPQGGITTGTEVMTGLAAGNYTVGMQDGNGCQTIFPITITQPATALSATTTQTNVTCFGTATGMATAIPAGGTAGYTYSWSPTGGTAATANNLMAQPYTVTVTDANLCTTTSTLTITQPNPFIASITSQTNVSCFGGNNGSAIATQVGGTAPYTYSWAPIGGTTTTASNLTSQVYTITVTDNNLCPATTTVNIIQPPVLTASTTSTEITCNGLTNGSATVTAGGGTAGYTYNWTPAGGTAATASNLSSQNYTVTVTDANSCTATSTVNITQPPALTLTAVTTSVTCFGLSNGSATATASGGTGPTYTVGIIAPPQGGITTGTEVMTGLAAGNYTVGMQDGNGCQTIFPITITQPATALSATTTQTNVTCFGTATGMATAIPAGGTAGYTYSWSPMGGTAATANNLMAQPYTVTVTDANLCTTTASLTITQPPVLTVSSVPKTICISNTTTLTAIVGGGTIPYAYLWSDGTATQTDAVNPITTTVFNYTVTDAKNCVATNTVTVFVRDSLKFLAVSPGVEMCNGFSANLNATGSGGDSTFVYTWNPGPIVGQNITVRPTTTTIYTLVLTDACGTPSVTTNVTVTIDSLPKITFTSNKQNGCYPLCVQFTGTTQIAPSSIQSYVWNLGGGYVSTSANPAQCYTKPGIYTVDVTTTSDKGCISHDTINNMITVYNHPVANFYYSPDIITILNPTVQFMDASTAPGSIIKSVFWQTFGDGSDSVSTAHNPIHIYQDTGTFCVNLIATNALGCTDTTQQCVVIKPYFTLYVPNAFTPNGDGINDEFYAIGEYVSTFDMKIFDRWGTVVYHTNNILSGWNGSKGGASAKEDIYVYLINATDALNKPHSYKGTVTLVK